MSWSAGRSGSAPSGLIAVRLVVAFAVFARSGNGPKASETGALDTLVEDGPAPSVGTAVTGPGCLEPSAAILSVTVEVEKPSGIGAIGERSSPEFVG